MRNINSFVRNKFAAFRKGVETAFGYAVLIAMGIGLFASTLLFLKPLWPLITLAFVAWLILSAYEGGRRTRLMGLGGIALYASEWVIAPFLGPFMGQAASALGFIALFQAALSSFTARFPKYVLR